MEKKYAQTVVRLQNIRTKYLTLIVKEDRSEFDKEVKNYRYEYKNVCE